MKPFDLAAALAGAPVVTRDGRKVLQLAHFPEASPDIGLVILFEGSSTLNTRREDGTRFNGNDSSMDLFMAPVKQTVWVNMYRDLNGTFFSVAVGDSKESAAAKSDLDDYIGTYPVEIEE